MSLEKAMTNYCNNSKRAPPLEEMRDSVMQRANENCSSDASLDLVAVMDIINMVLYAEKKVDLSPLHGLLKRAMEVVKTRQSPLLGGNGDTYSASGDSRPVGAFRQPSTDSSSLGNPYRPAIISPFATRQSGSEHRQDHHRPNSAHAQRESSRMFQGLPPDVKNSIDECLKAVLVGQRNNVEYLKGTNCWKEKVAPAVSSEHFTRHGVTLYQRLDQHGPTIHKGLNEFLRQRYRTMQSKWGIEDLKPKCRMKRKADANVANSRHF